MKTEITAILFGEHTVPQFAGLLFWALFAAVFVLLIEVNTRNVFSERTPKRFSLSFLLLDNARRLLITLMGIYLALRFTPELMGFEISQWGAVLVGGVSDSLSMFFKNKLRALKKKLAS